MQGLSRFVCCEKSEIIEGRGRNDMVFTDLAVEDLANALEEEEEDKNEV